MVPSRASQTFLHSTNVRFSTRLPKSTEYVRCISFSTSVSHNFDFRVCNKPCTQHAGTKVPPRIRLFFFHTLRQPRNVQHCAQHPELRAETGKAYKREPSKQRANRLCNHVTTRPLDNVLLLYKVL